MIVLGIDLGVRYPARATIDMRSRKPVLIGSDRGNFAKLPTKQRPEASFAWLKRELEIAWTSDIRNVAIEDPRNTRLQMLKAGKGTRSTLLLLEQFSKVVLTAETMGFRVVTLEPRSIAAHLGIKLPPKASVEQRRRDKKAQTKRWCEVVFGVKLDEDRADAASIAFVGACRLRVNRRVG